MVEIEGKFFANAAVVTAKLYPDDPNSQEKTIGVLKGCEITASSEYVTLHCMGTVERQSVSKHSFKVEVKVRSAAFDGSLIDGMSNLYLSALDNIGAYTISARNASSGTAGDILKGSDGNLETAYTVSGANSSTTWYSFDFGSPVSASMLAISPGGATTVWTTFKIQSSTNGSSWTDRKTVTLNPSTEIYSVPNYTLIPFPIVSARYFRIYCEPGEGGVAPATLNIRNMMIGSDSRSTGDTFIVPVSDIEGVFTSDTGLSTLRLKVSDIYFGEYPFVFNENEYFVAELSGVGTGITVLDE